jgi:hypothetical protein
MGSTHSAPKEETEVKATVEATDRGWKRTKEEARGEWEGILGRIDNIFIFI